MARLFRASRGSPPAGAVRSCCRAGRALDESGPAASPAVSYGASLAPPATVEAVWSRGWHAWTTCLERVNYLVASAEETLPADAPANLGAELAALVSPCRYRAEALHVLVVLEEEKWGFGGASRPTPGTQS